MKRIITTLLLGTIVLGCNQGNDKMDEAAVRDFAISHIENQVGYGDAVEPYYQGLSSELIVWPNPGWKNLPRKYDMAEENDGSVFYEDSIKVTIHDVYMMNGYANVMGTIQWFIAGVNTTYRNFSGIVAKEDGQLKWTRFVGIDHATLSKGFLWPSTEIDGGLDAYNEMRENIMNLEFERAKEISDSLVEVDPTWATAHLGQLQYYWAKRDFENLNATRELAESKLENASRAESHFIKSYTTDREAGKYHLEQALIFAPADPMLLI